MATTEPDVTAANEKPDCPCCRLSDTYQIRGREEHLHGCSKCGCVWDESKRRAQPAEAVDERAACENYIKQHAIEWGGKDELLRTLERDMCDEYRMLEVKYFWEGWIARARGGK